jgi:pimeloyl-ACP methyl ester carboxylesterase
MTDDRSRLEKGNVSEIPFLSCSKRDGEAKPLVILSHPFTASKDMWTDHLRELSDLGYYAVALDNRGHGERGGATFKERVFVDRKVDVCAVRRLIKETADDIPPLVDHLAAQNEVDGDRIGMVGVSMGGYITFRALAMDTRIRVAATVIASPYWDDTPQDMPALTAPEAIATLQSYSRTYGPAQHVDRFYPRPLLMQLGSNDIHFNQDRVIRFHRELETRYRDAPDKLQLVMHKGVGHEFTPPMWARAKSWLQTHR